MDLTGKNVVITGASSGIGLEILKLLIQKGCRVVACARHIEKISINSPDLFLTTCDVSKKEDVDALFNYALEKLGAIDLFIANAGFAYYEKLSTPNWQHIESIINTNFISSVYSAEKMKDLNQNRPYNFAVTASAMANAGGKNRCNTCCKRNRKKQKENLSIGYVPRHRYRKQSISFCI